MSHNEVRKGITNAKFNEEQSGILLTEILMIAIGFGLYAQSWWVFGSVLAGLIISLSIPAIAIPLMIALSIIWGILGAGIGYFIIESTGATVVLGIIGFLVGFGTHMAALQWTSDLGD